ncbi:4Fe-4S binding protein [Clostridium sp. WLY-B-L2]|uniref:4Fe-4S binding protein n=1 Tax=Clostridium aromativorans TaxID=2836848 RepID=A0ABS8N708_9CLOT|nr:4Fe-4S binding protein [Clostridium aromativorans]MCC9295601.1 4Fe-4S binding protein [Clostridium aromativorans]
MNKPKVEPFNPPKKIGEYPLGPSSYSGHLTEVSSGMRTFRAVIDTDKCVKCLRCFMLCPDGAIDKSGDVLEIDYDYCKGCGICAKVCKFNAVSMKEEGEYE